MGLNTAIATRVNGAAAGGCRSPDIELGSLDFWALDDDVRDGAFACCRGRLVLAQPDRAARSLSRAIGVGAHKYDDVLTIKRRRTFRVRTNITINDQTQVPNR